MKGRYCYKCYGPMPEGQWGSTCNACRTIKAIDDQTKIIEDNMRTARWNEIQRRASERPDSPSSPSDPYGDIKFFLLAVTVIAVNIVLWYWIFFSWWI